MSERIAAAFAANGKRAALMPYLMGGFPDLDTSRRIGEAYVDAGADLIELGVPFSDPLADGPSIHAAATAALRAGATVDGVLEVGRALARRVPVALMVYANLVLRHGADAFATRLRDGGIDGLIVPDLPSEEADGVLAACDAAGVALIPLAAPTTTDHPIIRTADACAPSGSPAPSIRPTITWPAIATESRTSARKKKSCDAI